jgi:hypothetical protein
MFELISLPCDRAVQATWYTYLTLKALNAALHFKHEAYRSEQEYRFLEGHGIGPRVPGVKLRYRPYAAVRYREFNWRKLAPAALTQIIIGPAADTQKALQFSEDCVRFFHSDKVKMSHSDIPYRAV